MAAQGRKIGHKNGHRYDNLVILHNRAGGIYCPNSETTAAAAAVAAAAATAAAAAAAAAEAAAADFP